MNGQMELAVGRLGRRALIALALVVASGCDSAPAEIVEELNAARAGCTEEKLKAGDEQCVQMFERYAEMGADAMETYIGGMRALDEAIQRRGGIQFDTAGLGRAFSDGIASGTEPRTAPFAGTTDTPAPGDRAASGAPEWADSDGGYSGDSSLGGRWEDVSDAGPGGWSDQPMTASPSDRRPLAEPPARGQAPRRGVLLPPDQRLNRPWIGDEADADPYLERERPTTGDTRRQPAPADAGWEDDPYLESPGGRWE